MKSKKATTEPKYMVKRMDVYRRTKYGSYVAIDEYGMAQEKNASSYERLLKHGFKPDPNIREVVCKICGCFDASKFAHRHQGKYVCHRCWDERLRTTE